MALIMFRIWPGKFKWHTSETVYRLHSTEGRRLEEKRKYAWVIFTCYVSGPPNMLLV